MHQERQKIAECHTCSDLRRPTTSGRWLLDRSQCDIEAYSEWIFASCSVDLALSVKGVNE